MSRIGPYEIVEEIGRGGMGIVFRAIDPVIGRPVAIKTIRLDNVTDPQDREWLRAARRHHHGERSLALR